MLYTFNISFVEYCMIYCNKLSEIALNSIINVVKIQWNAGHEKVLCGCRKSNIIEQY